MNQNQVKQKNLKFYNKFLIFLFVLVISSCTDDSSIEDIYNSSDFVVDSSVSLDCSGIWENNPLCKERNEALIALKDLEESLLLINDDISFEAITLKDDISINRKSADKEFFNEFYFKARDIYISSNNQITAYISQRSDRLQYLILEIENAINTNNIENVNSMFDEAYELDSSNKKIINLSERYKNYSVVTKKIDEAYRALENLNYRKAKEIITNQYEIDKNRTDVKNAYNDILSIANEKIFTDLLNKAYNKLQENNLDESYNFYLLANDIYPNNKELKPFLNSYNSKKTIMMIDKNKSLYQAEYGKENWKEALSYALKLVTLDPSNKIFGEYFDKTTKLKKYSDDFNLYLTRPDRLSDSNIRNNLRSLIREVELLDLSSEKSFINNKNKLKDLLAKYSETILLKITSNNSTYIDIQKTLKLDPFDIKTIKLNPGSYTIVAKRPGYQSYMKKVDLLPGSSMNEILAVCEDELCQIIDDFSSNTETITSNDNQVIELNTDDIIENTNYIKDAKISSRSFSKNLVCNQVTQNRNFKVSYELSLLNNGRVASLKLLNKPNNLSRDDNRVLDIVSIALSKSSFNFSENNYINSSKKVKHTINIPSNFCTN